MPWLLLGTVSFRLGLALGLGLGLGSTSSWLDRRLSDRRTVVELREEDVDAQRRIPQGAGHAKADKRVRKLSDEPLVFFSKLLVFFSDERPR